MLNKLEFDSAGSLAYHTVIKHPQLFLGNCMVVMKRLKSDWSSGDLLIVFNSWLN